MAKATESIPRHIGYVLDGNRRWAKKHGIPAYEGHLAGYNVVHDVVIASFEEGVEFVTIYLFSTENWKRSKDEVSKIMGLMLRMLKADLPVLLNNNIRLKVIGSRERIEPKIIKAIDNAESKTAHCDGGTLLVCFNYGGHVEIADAFKALLQQGVEVASVTPELIEQNLYSPEVPPLDLIIRTSGEQRLSNFMLWRAAYSEFIFLDKLWPDMTKEDVTDIIETYLRRGRRFGG